MEKFLLQQLPILGALIPFTYLLIVGYRSLPLRRVIVMIAGWQIIYHLFYHISLWYVYALTPHLKYLTPTRGTFLIQLVERDLTAVLSGWVFGVIFGIAGYWIFIRRGKEQYLDSFDLALLLIGVVAVGWPAGLIFFAGVFAFSIVGMIGLIIVRKKQVTDRLIITPYIIPAAILTLLFKVWLLDWTGLTKIRF